MKRSARLPLAENRSVEPAFAIVEAGIARIVAGIARKRRVIRGRRAKAA